MSSRRVFVTVGTTKFDKLIQEVSSDKVLDVLHSLGYTSIQFQVGTGKMIEKKHAKIKLKYDMYFDNFGDEINLSDLVISHAGAGTCIEVLRKHKPLLVVINEDLMDNHQIELAEQLARDGYLKYCTTTNLSETLLESDFNNLKEYPAPDVSVFSKYLDTCMGFQ